MPPGARCRSAARRRCFALLLGVPLAFALVRGRFFGRVLVDRMALAPVIVPTIILSVAVYGLFAKLKLIGTWYGLVIAHTCWRCPSWCW
jgi:putative spermidine/putrescine transport system permease protein